MQHAGDADYSRIPQQKLVGFEQNRNLASPKAFDLLRLREQVQIELIKKHLNKTNTLQFIPIF